MVDYDTFLCQYDLMGHFLNFILLFLCISLLNDDEQIQYSFFSRKLRSWIDRQNSNFFEKVKEAKERVLAAKDKVMQLGKE